MATNDGRSLGFNSGFLAFEGRDLRLVAPAEDEARVGREAPLARPGVDHRQFGGQPNVAARDRHVAGDPRVLVLEDHMGEALENPDAYPDQALQLIELGALVFLPTVR